MSTPLARATDPARVRFARAIRAGRVVAPAIAAARHRRGSSAGLSGPAAAPRRGARRGAVGDPGRPPIHHRQRARRALPLRHQLRRSPCQRGRRQRLVVLSRVVPRVLLREARAAWRLCALQPQQRPNDRSEPAPLLPTTRVPRVVRGERRHASSESCTRSRPGIADPRWPHGDGAEVARVQPQELEKTNALRRKLRPLDVSACARVLPRPNWSRPCAETRVRRLSPRCCVVVLLHRSAWQRDRHASRVGGALSEDGSGRHRQRL